MNAMLNLTNSKPASVGMSSQTMPLPLPDEAPLSQEHRRNAELPAAAKTILLVDDDSGVRGMLGRVLEFEHYVVHYATTGEAASEKFFKVAPDLVLLDLNMPGADGWTAFNHICEKDPMVPVIVITARPGQYQQAVKFGVDALMEKPLNFAVLLDAIRKLLSETEAERARRLTDRNFRTVLLKNSDQ